MLRPVHRLFSDGVQSGLFTTMVILDLLLVFLNLTVQLVKHGINGGIEIVTGLFDVHILSWHMDSHFRFLLQFLNGKNDANTCNLVKMTDNGIQLVLDVFAKCWGNFDMVTTNLQIHFFLLSLQGLA